MIPLPETARILLIPHYVGTVAAWKSDDSAETTVFAVRDPRVDVDDLSFYAATKAQLLAGQLSYLGTTTRGKDGGVQPLVFNDGTVVVLLCESPAAGDPGALNDLFAVTLQYRVGAEPAAGAGAVDQAARNAVQGLARALVAAAAQFD